MIHIWLYSFYVYPLHTGAGLISNTTLQQLSDLKRTHRKAQAIGYNLDKKVSVHTTDYSSSSSIVVESLYGMVGTR